VPEAREYLVLSNSKVKTWNRCPKQWEFKYIYGLRPKKKTIQLERGSWVHELLMVHYDGHRLAGTSRRVDGRVLRAVRGRARGTRRPA
jgi:hypothetical protein